MIPRSLYFFDRGRNYYFRALEKRKITIVPEIEFSRFHLWIILEFHFGGEEQIEIVSPIYFECILIFLVIFARITDFQINGSINATSLFLFSISSIQIKKRKYFFTFLEKFIVLKNMKFSHREENRPINGIQL